MRSGNNRDHRLTLSGGSTGLPDTWDAPSRSILLLAACSAAWSRCRLCNRLRQWTAVKDSVPRIVTKKETSTNQVDRLGWMKSRAICFQAVEKPPKAARLLLSSTDRDLEMTLGQHLGRSRRYTVSLRMEGSTASLYRLAH